MQALNTKGSSDNEDLSEVTDMNFAFTEFLGNGQNQKIQIKPVSGSNEHISRH